MIKRDLHAATSGPETAHTHLRHLARQRKTALRELRSPTSFAAAADGRAERQQMIIMHLMCAANVPPSSDFCLLLLVCRLRVAALR